MNKPKELIIMQLREAFLTNCSQSGLSLYDLDILLERLYKEVHAQYAEYTRNVIEQYQNSKQNQGETL